MESPPTTPTGIPGAVLTITNGPNAGRSVVTNALGFYMIADLDSTPFTVAVSADGYVPVAREQLVIEPRTDFVLQSVAARHQSAYSDDLNATDGTCDDGSGAKPCRIVLVPVHNPGRIHAGLHWSPADAADLDLTLFKTGVSVPITRSAAAGSEPEEVTADVPGGAYYEFRITLRSGGPRVRWTLALSYPD